MEYLISQPERAREMGISGRRFIGVEYDKEIMVRRIDKLYRELLLQLRDHSLFRSIGRAIQSTTSDLKPKPATSVSTRYRQIGKPGLN